MQVLDGKVEPPPLNLPILGAPELPCSSMGVGPDVTPTRLFGARLDPCSLSAALVDDDVVPPGD